MPRYTSHLILAGVMLAVLASPAFGQARQPQARVADVLSAVAAARYAPEDTLTRFRTRVVPEGRVDIDDGVLRARYRIEAPPPPASLGDEAVARRYLADQAGSFGMEASLDDLVLADRVESEGARHLTFQQMYRGIPVYHRTVRVNLDGRRAPAMVLSGYAPNLARNAALDVQPLRSAGEVLALARDALQGDLARSVPAELVVIPRPEPRLAWRLVAWSERNHGEWELLIDDRSGALIQIRDLSTHARPYVASPSETRAHLPPAPAVGAAGMATGQGFAFNPDPLSTSGLTYAQAFDDADDQDVPAINDQRVLVDLPDIALGNDGLYRLEGPHVKIVGQSPAGSDVYAPPAETLPDGFRYGRADDAFEAVNVYYHVDTSQRYVKSLNIGRPIQDRAISINPFGLGNEDNSRFYPTLNYIAFGAGGVDDAEDAFVIWHEYGHALLQESAPGLLDSAEGRALHEGWADYWAASYARFLAEEGGLGRSDWETFFKWDSGDGAIWAGRHLAFQGTYPTATQCDDRPTSCDIYADGMLWAVSQMAVYDVLGRTVTDRLNLASHAYLMHPVTFRDAAEAVIQADLDLYAGEHATQLFDLFEQRGLVDRTAFSPLATHVPITWVEQLGGEVAFVVDAVGVSSEIDAVSITYGFDGTLTQQLTLNPAGDDRYEGVLALPSEAGNVVYAVEVTDKRGLMTRLPSADMETRYSFTLGPDAEPPVVAHEPLGLVALADWPPVVTVEATDNLGIEGVSVLFRIVNPLGGVIADSSFGLTRVDGSYQGAFPVPVEDMEPASVVSYQIVARDRSLGANETALPADGPFTFSIVADGGVLRFYDFEASVDGIESNGLWQQATPVFGTRFAHSGARVWGINPAGAYSDQAGISSLTLPPLRVRTAGDTYLVFWHYYDTESAGDGSTTLWDGGNIKVSEDGGATWRVLDPVGGYDGVIDAGRSNPMGGQAAFGGFSYGWQRAVVSLPVADEVLLRFDFGTDAGNDQPAQGYAGWYLDDITVLGEAPEDVERPEASLLPAYRLALSPGQDLPDLYVEAGDNVGVERVEALYKVYRRAGIDEGAIRLPMSADDRRVFEAPFALASGAGLVVGDSITFRLRLVDFDGNIAVYPASDERPFRIEYRLQEALNLMPDAVLSGSWRWDGTQWSVQSVGNAAYSGLVMGPLDLPDNVDNLSLLLIYQWEASLRAGEVGMNVKLSDDGGASWALLQPVDGYEGVMASTAIRQMAGESAFVGRQVGLQQAVFDLLERKGRQIYLRIDAAGVPGPEEGPWRVGTASLRYSTLETVGGGFDIPRALALHANYPNPFTTGTNLSYTLAEEGHVELAVYDVLGRQMDVLVDATQPAGSYTLPYEVGHLASGVYLLRLSTPAGVKVVRLVKVERTSRAR
ncbi:MAG: T9SS type A sorting domain-containing protein [Rhodothermales bacterium]